MGPLQQLLFQIRILISHNYRCADVNLLEQFSGGVDRHIDAAVRAAVLIDVSAEGTSPLGAVDSEGTADKGHPVLNGDIVALPLEAGAGAHGIDIVTSPRRIVNPLGAGDYRRGHIDFTVHEIGQLLLRNADVDVGSHGAVCRLLHVEGGLRLGNVAVRIGGGGVHDVVPDFVNVDLLVGELQLHLAGIVGGLEHSF